MAAATNGGNPLILGAILIGGAILYSRMNTVKAQPVRTAPTMPGSAGSGTRQVVGGILGSVASWLSSSPTASRTWTTWEPLDGVTHEPQHVGGFVAVQDVFKAGIENEPVYRIDTTRDIIMDAAGTDTFGVRPGAYWS